MYTYFEEREKNIMTKRFITSLFDPHTHKRLVQFASRTPGEAKRIANNASNDGMHATIVDLKDSRLVYKVRADLDPI